MKIIYVLLIGLILSCQDMSNLTDLSPEDGISDHYWFDGIAFAEAFILASPDEPVNIYPIDRPDHLHYNQPWPILDAQWYTTDTFAFDPQDFQPVLDRLDGTFEAQEDIVVTSVSGLSWIRLGNVPGYSIPLKNGIGHYLIRSGSSWIKITRAQTKGGYFPAYHYTVHGLFLKGEVQLPDGDIS